MKEQEGRKRRTGNGTFKNDIEGEDEKKKEPGNVGPRNKSMWKQNERRVEEKKLIEKNENIEDNRKQKVLRRLRDNRGK